MTRGVNPYWNHKSIHRKKQEEFTISDAPNSTWFMEFMVELLEDDCASCLLTVLDDFNDESLEKVDF